MLIPGAGGFSAGTPGRPMAREVLAPWLVDLTGRPIYVPVPIWPVFRRTSRAGASVAPTLVAAVPGTPWTIEPGALSHIYNRHSDGARTRALAEVAADPLRLTRYTTTGYFFPQYSTMPAIIGLLSDIYDAVGPDDISPNRFGDLAVVAGALYAQETTMKQTIPILIGLNGLHGSPTNQAVVLLKSNNSVSTMYPVGNVRPYVP